jgi:hypothetical protein
MQKRISAQFLFYKRENFYHLVKGFESQSVKIDVSKKVVITKFHMSRLDYTQNLVSHFL